MVTPPPRKATHSDFVKTALRLPKDLHAELAAEAERNGRSLNAEILTRLQGLQTAKQLDILQRDTADIKNMVRELLRNTLDT